MICSIASKSQTISVVNSSGTNIYYNITSSAPPTVSVIQSPTCYSGILVIPDSINYNGTYYKVNAVGDSAFYGCSALTSVILPATITNVGDYVFFGNTLLRSIYCYAIIPPLSTIYI